jgi:hypothetical protein
MSVFSAVVFDAMFVHTAGHGYLQVKCKDIAVVGTKPSSYSPTDGEFIFLEEDVDAGEFMDAVSEMGAGIRITHTNDPIWEEYIDSIW